MELSPAQLDLAVSILRSGQGWRPAVEAINAQLVAAGQPRIDRRTLRRHLQKAGRLEAFPHAPWIHGRPRKPWSDEDCKVAAEARSRGLEWEDVADLVNAGRRPEDRVSKRTIRDRLAEAEVAA